MGHIYAYDTRRVARHDPMRRELRAMPFAERDARPPRGRYSPSCVTLQNESFFLVQVQCWAERQATNSDQVSPSPQVPIDPCFPLMAQAPHWVGSRPSVKACPISAPLAYPSVRRNSGWGPREQLAACCWL